MVLVCYNIVIMMNKSHQLHSCLLQGNGKIVRWVQQCPHTCTRGSVSFFVWRFLLGLGDRRPSRGDFYNNATLPHTHRCNKEMTSILIFFCTRRFLLGWTQSRHWLDQWVQQGWFFILDLWFLHIICLVGGLCCFFVGFLRISLNSERNNPSLLCCRRWSEYGSHG